MVKTCNYGAVVDSFLPDMIVLGVADPLVREKLLYEKDLLLEKVCDIVRACESAKAQLPQFATSPVDSAHALQARPQNKKHENKPSQQPSSGSLPEGRPGDQRSKTASDGQQQTFCNGCGRRHKKNQCRAFNVR